jgi:hypothetical protein
MVAVEALAAKAALRQPQPDKRHDTKGEQK